MRPRSCLELQGIEQRRIELERGGGAQLLLTVGQAALGLAEEGADSGQKFVTISLGAMSALVVFLTEKH